MPPATTTAPAADPAATALASVAPAATAAAKPAPAGTVVPKYNYSNDVSGDQALQDLTNFQTSAKSPIDIYNEATASLGIPDVRTKVTSLRKNIADTDALLSALPDSVSGRTSGSLVTESQRQRILATERAPLDQANQGYSRDYQFESSNLNDLTNQATQQSSLVSEGQKNIESALQTRLTNIQSKEAEARRRQEADRAFQATLDSIRVQQEQFAKQMAASTAQFNESKRQFDANYKLSQQSLAASQAKANAPNVLQQASSDAARLLVGVNSVLAPGSTEKRIIPTLQSQYPELSEAQIKQIVYSTRKAQYGF